MNIKEIEQNVTDEELMIAYANGDASAFDCLYNRHKQAVYRFFLRQNLPVAVAEELTHDVWLKIINARKNYTVSAQFKTWLFTIVKHIAIDYQQKKSTSHELNEACLEHYEISVNISYQEGNTKLQLALKREIAALPFDQRETFLLKQEAGFTIDEIAEITQQNKEKVKSSWRYALQKLREGLDCYVE